MLAPDQVLTARQMRAAEDSLIDRGISVDELMRRAGSGAAEWIWRVAMGRSVTVLCGPGNNGGDGYVIAQALRARGLSVEVIAPHSPTTDAARNACSAWTGDTVGSAAARHRGVFVDCLFGSGLSRPLSCTDASMLAKLVAQHDLAVAIDLPSGIETDDGALLGQVPDFHLTLALGAWKPAHHLMPAIPHMGALRCVDIGIEPVASAAYLFPRPVLSAPPIDAHKYSRGLVGVVAGAMPGAALLAAEAAMRGGAGYVKLLSPHAHPTASAGLVVDAAPLGQALADRRWSALLVGPGLGRDDAARDRLSAVLERGLPTAVDADALHLLDDDVLEGVDTSRLLVTPHAGELDSLCKTFAIIAHGKADRVRSLAQATGVTVLAKGPDTVLAAPDGRLAFFPPAPVWLATAGTGDVLAGLAASRLATGADPFSAAGEAVWIHGEAARMAGPMFTVDDLLDLISRAYKRFL